MKVQDWSNMCVRFTHFIWAGLWVGVSWNWSYMPSCTSWGNRAHICLDVGSRFERTIRTWSSYLIPQFQSWYAGVSYSEFQYQVEHIPRCKLVAGGLTRVSRFEYESIKPAGRYLWWHYQSNLSLGGRRGKYEVGMKLSKQDMTIQLVQDRFAIFAKFHNSSIWVSSVRCKVWSWLECAKR